MLELLEYNMKTVMMSTYNQICGIADYTQSLIKHFSPENEIKIIAPYLNTDTHHSLKAVGEEDPRIERLFNATIWDGIIGVNVKRIEELADWSDIFHIQFQDALYHHEWFFLLIERLKSRTNLVITMHDTCLGKVWPLLKDFKLKLTMKPEVQTQVAGTVLFGMPTYNTPIKIKGFGLGRSKHDNIKRICESLGYTYEYQLAENKWLPINELIDWLRDSDGIVLYYDEVGSAGSSAAARTALSTKRPVFVDRVTWFNDLPENVVHKFDPTDESLLEILKKYYETTSNNYIKENSFDNIAKLHESLYQSLLN